jgi:hypothetical protein
MLVVPLNKDHIATKDGAKYRVIEYTKYKDGGPAVYCKIPKAGDVVLVYFFDIAEINGTSVEYQRSSKVFRAFGKISRDQQLPQPDDKVIVFDDKRDPEGSKRLVEVASLKLNSKNLGINKGMFFKDRDGKYHRIKNILDLDPSLGTHTFDRGSFISSYKDYIGV